MYFLLNQHKKMRFLQVALSFAFVGIVMAQQALPPARLVLPDTLAVAATTRTVTVSGLTTKPYGYVVWLPSDVSWMARHDVAVYIKPGDATSASAFVKQAIVSWTDDAATLAARTLRGELLAGGASAKAKEMADVDQILGGVLAQMQQRAGIAGPIPADRSARLAMLIRRTKESEVDAATVRALGAAHPIFRLAMGQAWAGDLGVASGAQATVELREVNCITGVEGGVVGRVTLTAGTPVVLEAPGAPVAVPSAFLNIPNATFPAPVAPINFVEAALPVPDSGGKNDLAIPLRWGVPEALRRQAMLSTGFVVWRYNASYNPIPTLANLQSWEISGLNGVKRLTRSEYLGFNQRSYSNSPVLASKLFSPEGSAAPGPNVANFTADSETFFVADDNERYEWNNTTGQITGAPYAEGQQYKYIVAALDLLGRPGLLSAPVTATACRTVPPPVPDVVDVQSVAVGTSQGLRLRWKASNIPAIAPPANGQVTTTTHYLIQRDRLKNTAPQAEGMSRATMPDQQSGLIAVALVPRGTGASDLTWTDPMVPNSLDYGATYFYTIRALHHGPCGYVASAPSPPVFGTFRDRVGPPQPSGGVLTACPRVGLAYTGQTDTLLPGAMEQNKVVLRIRTTRQDPGVKSVTVRLSYDSAVGESVIFPTTRLVYADGDVVWHDLSLPLASEVSPDNTGDRTATLTVRSYGTAGALSHADVQTLVLYPRAGGAPLFSKTRVYVKNYLTGSGTPKPDDNTTADIWERHVPGPPRSFVPEEQLNGTIGGYWGDVLFNRDRILVVQQDNGGWQDVGMARQAQGSSSFFLQGDNGTYRAWEIIDPVDSPATFGCIHEPFAGAKPEPLRVSLTLTAGTKDYRLYRRLDDQDLVLLTQGAQDFANPATLTLIKEDDFMPPNGGTIRYYGQVFDEHGNPSALTLLGQRIVTLPDLPIPVLEPPTSFVDGSGFTNMQIRASCPRPGVDRLEFEITPPPESHPFVAKSLGSDTYVFQSPAGSSSVTAKAVTQFLSGPIQPQNLNSPVVQTATVRVKANVEYQIKVWAVSDDGKTGVPSPTQAFIFSPPLAAGNVAWPARPLPTVRTHFGISPVLTTVGNASIGQLSVDPDRYPVGVRIGQVPLLPGQFTVQRPVFDQNSKNEVFAAIGTDSFLGTVGQSNWDSYLYSLETGYPGVGLARSVPVVLYRQQVRAYAGVANGNTGQATPGSDTVQVSPLVETLSTTASSVTGSLYTYLTDADVGLLANGNGTHADIILWDTTPIAEGATYHYYLVRFNPEAEIDQIIDAGEITIPES